jgi:hypothetical protein
VLWVVELTEEEKQMILLAKREYHRQWRSRNKERITANANRHWLSKSKECAMEYRALGMDDTGELDEA